MEAIQIRPAVMLQKYWILDERFNQLSRVINVAGMGEGSLYPVECRCDRFQESDKLATVRETGIF
jgi:hypothetical protein